MIGFILLLAVFICIASIFMPELRKLAKAILATAGVLVIGFWIVFEIFSK